jgi:hypothetical protein
LLARIRWSTSREAMAVAMSCLHCCNSREPCEHIGDGNPVLAASVEIKPLKLRASQVCAKLRDDAVLGAKRRARRTEVVLEGANVMRERM